MLRLRQSIERGLRHPLLGPLLLLLLGFVLAFMVFHVIEHGVEGQLLMCALLAAAALRLLVLAGRGHRTRPEGRVLADRAPPAVRERDRARRPPAPLLALPLRR